MSDTTRAKVLDTAKEITHHDRASTYGSAEDNFAQIAAYWTEYLHVPVNAVDVAAMMILMKVARLGTTPAHLDSWVDVAGYAACGAEVALLLDAREKGSS